MINTLKLSKRLREVGMEQAQADALADALNEELKESSVTKADLATAVADLKHHTVATCLSVCGALGVIQLGAIYLLILKGAGH